MTGRHKEKMFVVVTSIVRTFPTILQKASNPNSEVVWARRRWSQDLLKMASVSSFLSFVPPSIRHEWYTFLEWKAFRFQDMFSGRNCTAPGQRLVCAWYPTEFLKTSFQCRKRTDALSQQFDLPNLDGLLSGEWSILTMWVLGHHKLLKNMHTGIAAACSRIWSHHRVCSITKLSFDWKVHTRPRKVEYRQVMRVANCDLRFNHVVLGHRTQNLNSRLVRKVFTSDKNVWWGSLHHMACIWKHLVQGLVHHIPAGSNQTVMEEFRSFCIRMDNRTSGIPLASRPFAI